MGIYLRSITDTKGDTVDLAWYCSQTCYSDSLRANPPSDTFEEGGAYPCGSESDSPDHCATCGDPVGNPLTSDGEDYVREYVFDILAPVEEKPEGLFAVSMTEHGTYEVNTEEAKQRAATLLAEYSYLFPSDDAIRMRLEYLRREIEAEQISLAEIAELQGLAAHIEAGDTVLREWAGIPEEEA